MVVVQTLTLLAILTLNVEPMASQEVYFAKEMMFIKTTKHTLVITQAQLTQSALIHLLHS